MSGGFMGAGNLRRFPVYLLLDCSDSMEGVPISAVNEGLGIIYRTLKSDPKAREIAFISVIEFADMAEQADLVEVDNFVPPILQAKGMTALGGAYHLLIESLEHDLIPNREGGGWKGDYRPLALLLTDGVPTDYDYEDEARKIKALTEHNKLTLVALGCGDEVNEALLREVTEHVYLMPTITPEALRQFFQLFSRSVVRQTHIFDSDPYAPTIELDPTISEIIRYSSSSS